MAEVVSLEGPVEMVNGELAILIPLEPAGLFSLHSRKESPRSTAARPSRVISREGPAPRRQRRQELGGLLLCCRTGHDARRLEADAVDGIAGGHIQTLAVEIPERDVGRADLPLGLTADDFQIQIPEQCP